VWTCLEDPGEDVNRRIVTNTWRIAEDIEEEPKGFVMVQDGELSEKKVDEINEFFAGWDPASHGKSIIIEAKRNDKPVEDMTVQILERTGKAKEVISKPTNVDLGTMTMQQMNKCMQDMGKAMRDSGFGKPIVLDPEEIRRAIEKEMPPKLPSPGLPELVPVEKKRGTKRPNKYAPRPLSGDEKPKRRWFWPAVLAIMTLLSGAAAVLTIADKWPSEPNHSLIETSIAPYIEAADSIQFGYEREEDV
jgi:hypothetical protein